MTWLIRTYENTLSLPTVSMDVGHRKIGDAASEVCVEVSDTQMVDIVPVTITRRS